MSGGHGQQESAPVSPASGRPFWPGWAGLALFTAAYFGAFALYPRRFFVLGVDHFNAWFLDTTALLASNDAISRGLDPYARNPLDSLGRPHVYSHWWLHLRDLGLTRADAPWLGWTLAIGFLLTALWRLRPQSTRQFLWYAAVLCSSPVLLAVDRGNNDLVVFILLAALVPCLLSPRRRWRWVPPVLIAVAAMLKYYPAVAVLLMLAGADRRERRLRLLVSLLLLVLAGCSVADDLANFWGRAPQPEGLMSFGATALFNELGWAGGVPKLLCAGLGLGVVAVCWLRRTWGDWAPAPARQSDWLHFVLGAVLLTGCFFTSLNFSYRWIFIIWLAPWLWGLAHDGESPPAVRRLVHWTMGLLLVVLWWGPCCCLVLNGLIGRVPEATVMRLARLGFLVEQPFDWAFFCCLLVFLTHFARRGLAVIAKGGVTRTSP